MKISLALFSFVVVFSSLFGISFSQQQQQREEETTYQPSFYTSENGQQITDTAVKSYLYNLTEAYLDELNLEERVFVNYGWFHYAFYFIVFLLVMDYIVLSVWKQYAENEEKNLDYSRELLLMEGNTIPFHLECEDFSDEDADDEDEDREGHYDNIVPVNLQGTDDDESTQLIEMPSPMMTISLDGTENN